MRKFQFYIIKYTLEYIFSVGLCICFAMVIILPFLSDRVDFLDYMIIMFAINFILGICLAIPVFHMLKKGCKYIDERDAIFYVKRLKEKYPEQNRFCFEKLIIYNTSGIFHIIPYSNIYKIRVIQRGDNVRITYYLKEKLLFHSTHKTYKYGISKWLLTIKSANEDIIVDYIKRG